MGFILSKSSCFIILGNRRSFGWSRLLHSGLRLLPIDNRNYLIQAFSPLEAQASNNHTHPLLHSLPGCGTAPNQFYQGDRACIFAMQVYALIAVNWTFVECEWRLERCEHLKVAVLCILYVPGATTSERYHDMTVECGGTFLVQRTVRGSQHIQLGWCVPISYASRNGKPD